MKLLVVRKYMDYESAKFRYCIVDEFRGKEEAFAYQVRDELNTYRDGDEEYIIVESNI